MVMRRRWSQRSINDSYLNKMAFTLYMTSTKDERCSFHLMRGRSPGPQTLYIYLLWGLAFLKWPSLCDTTSPHECCNGNANTPPGCCGVCWKGLSSACHLSFYVLLPPSPIQTAIYLCVGGLEIKHVVCPFFQYPCYMAFPFMVTTPQCNLNKGVEFLRDGRYILTSLYKHRTNYHEIFHTNRTPLNLKNKVHAITLHLWPRAMKNEVHSTCTTVVSSKTRPNLKILRKWVEWINHNMNPDASCQ